MVVFCIFDYNIVVLFLAGSLSQQLDNRLLDNPLTRRQCTLVVKHYRFSSINLIFVLFHWYVRVRVHAFSSANSSVLLNLSSTRQDEQKTSHWSFYDCCFL